MDCNLIPFSYSSVINACIHTSMEDAQRLFDEYRERHKDSLHGGPYCALMMGWSIKSRERTEQLMQQLLDDDLVPPVHAFMAVLRSQTCGSASDSGESAQRWCLKYSETTNRPPDQRMLSLVLHAWAKSGHPDAGVQG